MKYIVLINNNEDDNNNSVFIKPLLFTRHWAKIFILNNSLWIGGISFNVLYSTVG
jgi:hypothetical protein